MKIISISVEVCDDGSVEYDACFDPTLTPAEKQRASDIIRRLLRDSLPYDARTSGIDVAPMPHDGGDADVRRILLQGEAAQASLEALPAALSAVLPGDPVEARIRSHSEAMPDWSDEVWDCIPGVYRGSLCQILIRSVPSRWVNGDTWEEVVERALVGLPRRAT